MTSRRKQEAEGGREDGSGTQVEKMQNDMKLKKEKGNMRKRREREG
jgi:hypothetical protein